MVLKRSPDRLDGSEFKLTSAPALEVDGLTKIYDKKYIALNQVSFVIEQGGFYALLGPNGAGKSTLINIITGLISKSAGSVRLFGYELSPGGNPQVKELIGLVSQEFNFNPFETVEHILYTQAGYYGLSRKKVQDKIEYYLKKLGLWEKRQQRARYLSGGMKRRLMIARALLHVPQLLILDEPTAGVDVELRRLMWDFLRELNAQGMTIILTSHYFEEVERLCRNIIILNKGKLIENKPINELLDVSSTKVAKNNFILELKEPLILMADQIELKPFELINIDDRHWWVSLYPHQGQTMSQLLGLLAEQGVAVVNVTNESRQTNMLETIFISLTQKENKNNEVG
ncbi:ABC transporter ATP-binding protein [Piscirickettsia salmonis]|uniref:ABC transporter ATP-binding protein YxlF n=2 Tax=Piscirickettsia salmonis TaxID=1238 RepID=A0A9Q6PTA5_PISSA|nr:ABC transporter ATP-binding protein [Piscirickettsia salmonis]ALA25864.1 ABC transporter family protein [Piscirickettsia salmonis]QGN78307.1 putative ABC transporter ATP-binding protein YxlF [Piscirickettsia salmonis]QGN81888.1 putative ABC transporter ATP-binding protein YxlF [Piscirickettsia salmonis]QGN83839.1 putative ABC transporter ATP-binding protein YxlF [Piscirickettsia salmonis]QGN87351.1 putative ABC transporter ATP-binding protein YxlF [Piscirickettsia salmonis]